MGIKEYIKSFIEEGSRAEPINDSSDYYRVKKWTKKATKLYVIFSIIAVIFSFPVLLISKYLAVPDFLLYTVVPAVNLLTGWGFATLFLYFKQAMKSVFKSAKAGFQAGESIHTTHTQVTHEYGNVYRVSSYDETHGCGFAFAAGMMKFAVWAVFCVYIGPFITFKKLRNSRKNLSAYNAK